MTVRIGGAGGAQWGSHIASIHLRTDCVRLSADVRAGADERTIRQDKAAIVETRRDIATFRRSGLVDITV
ncbi:hypothetical protein ACIA5D_18305 [Actinoplanes sp. NPDC051513]|uniref:hypothetical protein n=1 Tax=Actinoplanes sp. NPDC051513 TaxID=3363908 RepID=UPI0037A390AA